MTKYAFGLLAACALVIVASQARAADFSDQCTPFFGKMVKEDPQGKEALEKKYGGDVGKLCTCAEQAIKTNPKSTTAEADVDTAATYMTAINEAAAGGGSQADLDKIAGLPANSTIATVVIFAGMSCMAP